MVRPMVHSTKHYVQTSITSIAAGAVGNVTIADAVSVNDKNLVNEVVEGSTIKAVYLEHWLKAGVASNVASFIAVLYKAPTGLAAFSAAQIAAMGQTDNKKNVLYMTQGLINTEGSQATNVVKQWFKVPKSKQRMGLGDRIFWSISAQGTDVDHCGFTTYKEYT